MVLCKVLLKLSQTNFSVYFTNTELSYFQQVSNCQVFDLFLFFHLDEIKVMINVFFYLFLFNGIILTVQMAS